jgi:hypothetical protein
MYYADFKLFDLILAILGIIIILTFFVMAYRLKNIMLGINTLRDLKLSDPENWVEKECWSCNKKYSVCVIEQKKTTVCPHCKSSNKP